jgi:uncharacterized coiled-coil protein SlyX
MSDPAAHLKLDRILANQDKILSRVAEQEETIAVLIATLTTMNESIGTQTEVINRLSEAMSAEPGSGDLHELIKSISVSLKQIKEDGSRVHVALGRIAPAVAQAAQDAVFMAMGDGVAAPPEEPE